MKTQIKHQIAANWRTKVAPRIIYYHSIHPNGSDDGLSLPSGEFIRQISWLKEQGYVFLTFSDIVNQSYTGSINPKTVSITFDDGYLDNYQYAFPILKKFLVPATFFAVSALIKQESQRSREGNLLYPNRFMMTRNHIAELAANGMEVGSHTRTHIHVRETVQRSPSKALEELVRSRIELEEIAQTKILSFAYPNGQKGLFNKDTRSLLIIAGYKYAATTIWGDANKILDPLVVPRIEMKADDSFDVFQSKMNGQYDFLRLFHLIRDGNRQWEALSTIKSTSES